MQKNLPPVFITKELFIQVSAVAQTQMMHKTFNTAVPPVLLMLANSFILLVMILPEATHFL